MINKWDNRFLNLAKHVSFWSKDIGTKVGCVITEGKEKPILGYNGFPQGIQDSPNRLHDYNIKHKLVVHAEMNAILSANRNLSGNTLYCSAPPCIRCTSHIIRVGITKVVCLPSKKEKMRKHHVDIELSKKLFLEAGIEFDIMEEDNGEIKTKV